jgi:hypothetical protein
MVNAAIQQFYQLDALASITGEASVVDCGCNGVREGWKGWMKLKRPSPFVWLILSAGLFLVGAASFSGHGANELAQFGVLGAVAAIALIVAFLY